MGIDLQKANIWKRISAFLFDSLMMGILAVGIGFLLSTALGYDRYNQILNDAYDRYETKYGIEFEITGDEYQKMTEAERSTYDAAYDALLADEDAMHAYNMVVNLTMLVITFSLLIAIFLLEFIVPLRLGDGQTFGKKIFGIGVMRTDAVRLSTIQLFIRTILGKFTIETMIPVYVGIMIFFNVIGIEGTILLGILLIVQMALLLATRTHAIIHDSLAGTVVVDINSQRIFPDADALMEYKKKVHAEKAARQPY